MKPYPTVSFEDPHSTPLNSRNETKQEEQMESFYNKSLTNLMRLDQSTFGKKETILSNSVGIDDMIQMDRMTEESVVKNLQERYKNNQIYVSCAK